MTQVSAPPCSLRFPRGCCSFAPSMAIVINALEKAEALKAGGADLVFLFDKKLVDEDTQAKFFHIGVTTVEQLAVIAKDQTDLEEVLKVSFELDPKDLPNRIRAGRVVVAWLSAKARATKQADLDGECEARRVPKDIGTSDVTAMRRAFEKAWWVLEDSLVPAKTYLEKKLDEVEKDELRAEMLTEVLTVPEDDPDTLKTIWTSSNELKAVKVGARVSLPRDPEEFRRRITVLGTAWMFISYQQTHKQYLKGLSPQTFTEYMSYILGEFVLGLGAKDAAGNSLAYPSWSLVISYEHAIRNKAISLVKKGALFKDALRTAWEDPVTKERFFTTPLCLESSRKRPAETHSEGHRYEPAPRYTPGKNSGKGTGKNSGKSTGKNRATKKERKNQGKGSGKASGCASKTNDGQNICYRFNGEQGCDTTKCPFVHVCGVCFAKGVPMHSCRHGK